MEEKKDLKPLFLWARGRGDANIYDRILIKIIPALLKENIQLTGSLIENADSIFVSREVYFLTLEKTEELLGISYKGENDDV